MKLVKDINKESPSKPQVSDKEAEEAVKNNVGHVIFIACDSCFPVCVHLY